MNMIVFYCVRVFVGAHSVEEIHEFWHSQRLVSLNCYLLFTGRVVFFALRLFLGSCLVLLRRWILFFEVFSREIPYLR